MTTILHLGDRVIVTAKSAWVGWAGTVDRFDEEARSNPIVVRFDAPNEWRRGTTMHFAERELQKLPDEDDSANRPQH